MEIIPVFIWDEGRGALVPRCRIPLVASSLPRKPRFFDYEAWGHFHPCHRAMPLDVLPRTCPGPPGGPSLLSAGATTRRASPRRKRWRKLATSRGITTESFNSSLLQEPWETKNGTGKPFQVFTPYWRKSRAIIYREPASYDPKKLSFVQQTSSAQSAYQPRFASRSSMAQ